LLYGALLYTPEKYIVEISRCSCMSEMAGEMIVNIHGDGRKQHTIVLSLILQHND
jgi:hypothetical protein